MLRAVRITATFNGTTVADAGRSCESAMEALGIIGVRYLDTEAVMLTHGAWPRVYQ